jgi:RNA polymerase sigma-70 factor (ECF subfamily)
MSVAEALPARTSADQDLQGLYERHADRIFGFCRRRLRSHQEAEDATQTTFLQAFRALQRGVVPVSETAWLFKIAENVCLSAHRTNGRRAERELADGAEIVELAPARDGREDALFGLEEALATIPESQRRAFVLRELRGLSYKEIAAVAGISVTAVEMLVFRARRSLARALESGSLKGRVAGVLDLGAALNALKTALGGVTVAKVVSAAVVVAIATVPAGDSKPPVADRLPATVFAGTVERPGATPSSAFPATQRSSSQGNAVQPRAVPVSPVSSDEGTSTRLPRPGRLGNEPSTTPAAPPPAGPSPTPGTPVAPEPPSLPAIEPPAPEPPVQVPTIPQVSVPTVPELPVEIPTLPDLAVELPDPEEIELPPVPSLP